MGSENVQIIRNEHKPTFLEIQARNRRLADIRRGQTYFQKIDSLAERQWNKNTPHDSAGRRQVVTIRPLTDTQNTKSQNRQLMLNNGFEKKRIHSERPRGSERIVEEELFLVNSTTPRQKVPLDSRNHSPYFRNGHAEKISERLGIFNQWGSGVHPLDEKVTLTSSDLMPQFEPFRFRDSVKHVHKPTPKQYMPMSRAAHEKDRQIKVHTNFLSRNGLVNINPELEQWPEMDAESRQRSFVRDPELLQRERTTAFMNRLDKMIDPFKQQTDKMELTSSNEECEGSPPPSISDLTEVNPINNSNVRYSKGRRSFEVIQKLPLYPKYITQPQKPRRKNLTFSKLLIELNRQPMGASRKCKIWVNNLERVDSNTCKT